jgi:hypothetical protein
MKNRSLPPSQLGIPVVSPEGGQPGDCVVCHSTGILGWCIRLGERLQTGPPFCYFNHIAMLYRPIENANGEVVDWWIIQSVAHGIEVSRLSTVAPNGDYEIIPLTAFEPLVPGGVIDRDAVVAQMKELVGDHYGFLTIGCEAVSMLVPFIRIDVRAQGTFICSAAYAFSLHAGGAYVPAADIYLITPAQLVKMAYEASRKSAPGVQESDSPVPEGIFQPASSTRIPGATQVAQTSHMPVFSF